MNKIKRLVCLLAVFTLILPLGVFPSFADVPGLITMAAKYYSRTDSIITEDDTIKQTGFTFTETEFGEIEVKTPDYDTFPGEYPVSAITAERTTPIDGLTVHIAPDDFEFSIGDNFSLLWTEKPIDTLADPVTQTGLYDWSTVYRKGLRNLMPEGSKGLCINVGNSNVENNGTKTASDVSIIYYDGKTKDIYGNLGIEWRFTKKEESNIMPLVYFPEQDAYEKIDLTYGLTISIRADLKLGYVVSINGKNYGDASAALYPYWDVDLAPLATLPNGYLTVGFASGIGQNDNTPKNYTLSLIDGQSPVEWANNYPVCFHEFESEIITEATCETEGTCKYTCLFCRINYIEPISAKGHSFTNYEVISEPACTEDGIKTAICDNGCGTQNSITEEALGHMPGEWIVIEPPTYEYEGYKIRHCTVCSNALGTETIPVLVYEGFPDVTEDAWYYEGVEYCFKQGYIEGTDKGMFEPDAELTREQFVVILARAAGANLSEYTESPFTDVEGGEWFGSAVIWAYEEGIIQGIGNKAFGVGQKMTREELATVLYRYAKDENVYLNILETYRDWREVSEWARTAMNWAAMNNILGSTSTKDYIISPKMTVTRAQAAKIFMSYDKYTNK